MKHNWFIIGVAGVTNGGKTTLTRRLQLPLKEIFGLSDSPILFFQDDYFLPEDSDQHVLIPELQHANWDIVSSLDMDRMHADVECITSQPANGGLGIIIVEGNLILNHRHVAELFDRKYYFRLTKEECWERRKLRAYQPPDPPDYFEKCVWPMYEMYRKEVEDKMKDIMFLDGTRPIEETFQSVLEDIKAALDSQISK